MSAFVARAKRALAPAYLVEREIARGGMGVVVHAHDTALDRAVAIKIIRPELATAAVVERFTREARLLANLNHPRIVPVYSAGEADGLFYFVMPLIEGETLAERLKRGKLSNTEVVRLGLDILDGLASAHNIGVVHRDINARNVFIVDGRALLADFGLAWDASSGTREEASGTIGAMPPEQADGGAVTRATDVYAVGALLFSLLTGRPWTLAKEIDSVSWKGVPSRFARVLRRALQWHPAARYQDASAFRTALQHSARRARFTTAAVATLAVTIITLAFWPQPSPDATPTPTKPADLAILPFEDAETRGSSLGRVLARHIANDLAGVPRLQLTPVQYSMRWFDAHPDANLANPTLLNARHLVRGEVVRLGPAIDVRVRVIDRSGATIANLAVRGDSASFPALADSIALELLRRLEPQLAAGGLSATATRNVAALVEFLQGDDAFEQGAWLRAEQHYKAAIARDSTFMWAWWRLFNTWRWMPTTVPDPTLDLAGLYRRYGQSLPPSERLAVEAHLTPPGPERFHRLEKITQSFPHDGYAALMYGVELWHRGPLFRIPQGRSLPVLEQAITLNEYFAPAHENIAWIAIRTGDQQRARKALDRLAKVAGPPESMDLYTPAFFEQAYRARFEPDQSRQLLDFFDYRTPSGLSALRLAVRAGVMVKLPQTQAALAQHLLYAPNATTSDRANAFEALALSELLVGQHQDGFAHLDSAAALFRSPEAQLELTEWRALAPLFGWPRPPAGQAKPDWSFAESVPLQPATRTRVAWAQVLTAMNSMAPFEAAAAVAHFHAQHPNEPGAQLGIILDAMVAARLGDYHRAITISNGYLPYVAHGKQGDPFARAVVYVSRANWHEALDDRKGAESELMWTDNTDFVGWPSGSAQPAEVDFVLSGFVLARRSALSRARGDMVETCARLRELNYLVQGATTTLEVNSAGCTQPRKAQ